MQNQRWVNRTQRTYGIPLSQSAYSSGVLEVKERENGAQRPSEDIIAEKFTNLMKAQEVLWTQENELRKIGT